MFNYRIVYARNQDMAKVIMASEASGVMNLTVSWMGEAVSLAAAFAWSASVMLYRRYGGHLSATWITFYKGLIATLFFGLGIAVTDGWIEVSPVAIGMLTVSGIVGIIIGDSAFFMALPKIGGALTSAIQCIAPPLTAIGALFFLDQDLSIQQTVGLIVTSVGVAAMVWFERRSTFVSIEPKSFGVGVLFAIIAAVCQAGGVLLSRRSLEGLPSMQGAALRMWFPVAALGIYEAWRAGGSPLSFLRATLKVQHLPQISLAAFLGTFLGLIFMVYGTTHAPVGIALALTSTYPLWIVLLDVMVFGHKMRKSSVASLIVAVLGVFFMVL